MEKGTALQGPTPESLYFETSTLVVAFIRVILECWSHNTVVLYTHISFDLPKQNFLNFHLYDSMLAQQQQNIQNKGGFKKRGKVLSQQPKKQL